MRSQGGLAKGTIVRGGKPMEGATVVLMGGEGEMKMKTSDTGGRFTFDNVKPGDYTVMVQTGMMGGGSTSEKVVVTADGAIPEVHLELSTLVLEGRVVDAETGDGLPLAHVVLLSPEDGPASSLTDLAAQQKGQAMTAEDGSFKMDGVPAGTFRVRVSAGGYPQQFVEGVSAGGRPLTIRMEPGVDVRVKVVDHDGKALGGASVTVEEPGGRETTALDMTMQGITQAEGIATLKLRPGTYIFHAQAQGRPGGSTQASTGGADIVIKLPPGGTVEVVVRNADGIGIPGVKVTFTDADGKPITQRLTMSTIFGPGNATNADGVLVRAGLPLGRIDVTVDAPGGAASGSGSTHVRAGATSRVEIELR